MKRLFASTAALLVIVLTAFGCATPGGPGWDTLIDGEKGLENWNRIGDANWRVEGGAIVADKGTGNRNFLVSKKSYKDFELNIEFWADHTTNSGILLRAGDSKKIGPENSYEVNIYDQTPQPAYGTGGIVNYAVVKPIYKAGGKWNTFEIYVKGPEITVKLDGDVTVHYVDNKFPSGPFALQFANRGKEPGGVIKFRKVMIREL